MFLKHKDNGDLLEVLELAALFDPGEALVEARYHAGEEMPDPERFSKAVLQFPSGEGLPRCWLDPDYRA
jgi:hypothetical protein